MKLLRAALAIVLILTCATHAKAQTTDTIKKAASPRTQLAALIGYNLQKNSFAEIGIGMYQRGWIDYLPFLSSVSISDEISTSGKFIMGPKASVSFNIYSVPIAFVANLIDYTDFETNAWRFRPEIGLGLEGIRIVYGYNIPINNSGFGNINTHNFGIVVMFP